jgi:hypothetical protein
MADFEPLSDADLQRVARAGCIKFEPSIPATPGKLEYHVERDDTGREIRTWTGPKSAWMNDFKAPVYYQIKIDKDDPTQEAAAATLVSWTETNNRLLAARKASGRY